jgi:hypothetical protein
MPQTAMCMQDSHDCIGCGRGWGWGCPAALGEVPLTARDGPDPPQAWGTPIHTPTPTPTPGLRRSDTISSSSVASADEPSTTPFGPGERRTNDAVVTEPVNADVVEGGVVVPLVLGRAM